MHAASHLFLSSTGPSILSLASRCHSWFRFPTGRASVVPCRAVLVGRIRIRTGGHSFLVPLDLAARVDDRRYKLTIIASTVALLSR